MAVTDVPLMAQEGTAADVASSAPDGGSRPPSHSTAGEGQDNAAPCVH